MKKRNLLVLIILLMLIAAVAALSAVYSQSRTIPESAPSIEAIHAPAPDPSPDASPAAAAESSVRAYLVVTVGGMVYEPLPLGGDGSFTVRQNETTSNTIHVTPSSVWMEHSSCENQDCVDQGVVSLENMSTRILGNMIICLPNEVVLELHTPETLRSTFGVTP